jgi:hypothetical protein
LTFVRGSNPIWSEIDLTGHLFDDTFYMFVLTNDIPYIPLTVWQDPYGNVAWSNPIQFNANGTLPDNIYFDPTVIYRLEFRQGPTQNDPLIYPINNYMPGSGSGPTPGEESLITDNQVSNPQFALINFVAPTLTLTSISTQVIQIAPDWFLNLTGTGTVILTQVTLNSTVADNPTNASYGLQIQLSGSWTNAYLSQRYHQNGVLWSNTNVSGVIQALSPVGNSISSQLVDSQSHLLTDVIAPVTLTTNFEAFPGQGSIGVSSDTDLPPGAYIEYQILIPPTCNLTLTSIQLIASDTTVDFPYEQNTIERQIDQTFHYFKPQLSYKPIPSYLVGWDFPLNPAQVTNNGALGIGTTGSGNSAAYLWDQTILFQTVDASISVSRDSTTQGITIATANNSSFAMVQYLPTNVSRIALAQRLCSKLKGLVSSSTINGTISLWWTSGASLPNILANTCLVSSIASGGIPTCNNGTWNLVNNPQVGNSCIPFQLSTISQVFDFIGFFDTLTGATSATFMAVVIAFDTLLTSQTVTLNYCSLNAGDIPTRPAPQTPDEVYRECQYYYRKSFLPGQIPAANVTAGRTFGYQPVSSGSTFVLPVRFDYPMIHAPTVALLNPNTATNSQIRDEITNSNYSSSGTSNVTTNGFLCTGTPPGGSSLGDLISVQWTADARLGTF